MNKPETPTRWFEGWRTAQCPPEDDPADLGTAFGLEMSMLDSADAAPAPAAASPPGWVRRLADRRKRAT